MHRVRLALFPNEAAAVPVREALLGAGIGVEIHRELQLQRLWFVSAKTAGARLEVPLAQWEGATALLKQWDAVDAIPGQAIRCPECRSMRVDFPQYTPKSFLTNLAIGLLAELRLVERQYYCEECHCMWPKASVKTHRARIHRAPNYFIEDPGRATPGTRPDIRDPHSVH
jgi:hypothetical protein